eukprot:491787-Prorocentrum_minimum.AAC.1
MYFYSHAALHLHALDTSERRASLGGGTNRDREERIYPASASTASRRESFGSFWNSGGAKVAAGVNRECDAIEHSVES